MAETGLLTQFLVLGSLMGLVYALMSSGLTLIFGVMRVVNIAHGIFIVAGAYFAYWFFILYGVDPLLAGLLSIPFFFILGFFIYRAVIAGLQEGPLAMTVLATFGLALVIENSMAYQWTSIVRSIPVEYGASSILLGELYFPLTRVLAGLLAGGILTVFFLFLWKTRIGRAIRATMEDRRAAQLVGVNVERVSAVTFGLGMLTAGLGGSIMSIIFAFYPAIHIFWIARVLTIVVIGGLGSLRGAIVGAVLMGVVESLGILYLGLSWYPMLFYGFLVAALLLRPQGIFGEKRL